jgi:hypothetical protein
MDEFIKAVPGTTLLELLQGKEAVLTVIIESARCTSCLKPFTETRELGGHLRGTPAELRLPVSVQFPLCKECCDKMQRGGEHAAAVVAAVDRFKNGEVPQ